MAWSRRATLLALVALALVLSAGARADAAITYRSSSSANASSSTSLTIPAPAGLVSGDVMVVSLVTDSGTVSLTASGWTLIRSTNKGGFIEALYYKVAGSSEPSSYSFSSSASTNLAGGILDYSGISTSTPVDVSVSANSSSGNANCNSVTTTVNNDVVICAPAFPADVTVTPPSGLTERYDVSGTSVTAEASDYILAVKGSTGTKAAVPSPSTNAWITTTVALKVGSGTLDATANPSPTFGLTLSGLDQTTTYTLPVEVTDTRTTSTGWNLTVTSTQFTTGSKTLATTASTITGVTHACNSGSTCTTPTNSVTYPLTVPAGSTPPTAAKFYNAASGTGTGILDATPTVQVAVPANSSAGSYSSTVTLTVASGP
jgi:hypothetical protein